MSENTSSFGKKAKRYAQVTTAMGGLAARLAGERLGVSIDRDHHARSLKAVLGGLKGPIMKIGQFLATIPDTLPPEYCAEFSELQAHAPAMGWPFVRRRMRAELGPDWQNRFQTFQRQASAAASLGQVHQATSLAGDLMACKLQYPDMLSAIEADLTQLRMVLSAYESFSGALKTDEIQKEITLYLKEELDYKHEAFNCRLFQHMFKEDTAIHIPKLYPDLCTDRLITASWMEGSSILSFVDHPQEVRNQLSEKLFKAWYTPFYRYAVLHGDPHPGNYTVAPDGGLNLMDYGCVRVFPPAFVQGVVDLYYALQTQDRARAVHAYEQWGFKGLTNELIDVITQWAKMLYGPLLKDKACLLRAHFDGKETGWETATKVHKHLRKAGGIRPPRAFVFMDRAAVGVGSVIMRLKGICNWHQLFHQLIEGFSKARLADQQARAIQAAERNQVELSIKIKQKI